MEPRGKRLHIVSDGSPLGTVVTDDEGNVIQGVTHIEVRQAVGGPVEAVLTVVNVSVDLLVARRRVSLSVKQPGVGV